MDNTEIPYNKKAFLVPDSPRTMASFHAKIGIDNIMRFTLHDCNGSVRLWNDLNNKEEVSEAIMKLDALMYAVWELRMYIDLNYKNE